MSAADIPDQTTSPALDQARRHRVGVRNASSELERALAAPVTAPGPWQANVARRVRALADAFALHVVTTESPEGVLAESVTVNPRLAHRADMLRRDHLEIGALLVALGDQLSAGEPTGGSSGAGSGGSTGGTGAGSGSVEGAPGSGSSTISAGTGTSSGEGAAGSGSSTIGAGTGTSSDVIAQIRSEALSILTRISQHRYIGADLVYQAYMVDIEAAD